MVLLSSHLLQTVGQVSLQPTALLTAPSLSSDCGIEGTDPQVVESCNAVGTPFLSNLVMSLRLTEQEKEDFVEYIRALIGEGWQMEALKEFPK